MNSHTAALRGTRVAVLGIALALAGVLAGATGPTTTRGAEVFHVPADQGTTWEVLAGYNTSTHTGDDPNALDIWRVDGETSGSTFRAPVSGEVTYVASDCMGLRDSYGQRILLCHVLTDSNIHDGMHVQQGQRLGVVAPPGQANNNGVSHIHVAVHTPEGQWGYGPTTAFIGAYALEGQQLPDHGIFSEYQGRSFVSQNAAPSGDPPPSDPPPTNDEPAENDSPGDSSESDHQLSVSAGDDRVVAPGADVVLVAEGTSPAGTPVTYSWGQLSGPPVFFSIDGTAVSFRAPEEPGAELVFQVMVLTPNLDNRRDTVSVTVDGDAAVEEPDASADDDPGEEQGAPEGPPLEAGVLVGGEVPPSGGIGLIVYGGGSSDGLVAATGCDITSARFWASYEGRFVPYFPGTSVAAVNAEWQTLFEAGVPADTPLMMRCE